MAVCPVGSNTVMGVATGGRAVNRTVAVWDTVTVSVVSAAVNTSPPVAGVLERTVKVTMPAALDGPEAAEMTGLPAPEVLASVTVLPLTGLLLTSCKVTVMVEVEVPSATTEVGDALTVDWAAVTGPVNVTLAVCVMVMESELSVAVNTSVAAVVDFTVKVTTPAALEVPDAAEIVGLPEPEVFASVTVLPETGLPFASSRVTVMIEEVIPSAVTEPGEALTVDCAAVTGPAVKVTRAVRMRVTESELSVAVKTSAAAVVDFTVKVTLPKESDGPEAAEMIGLPEPEVLASVTVLPISGLKCASSRFTVMVDVVLPSAVTESAEGVAEELL